MNLVCFTEEQSAKEMLQVVLPKILPDNCPLSPFTDPAGLLPSSLSKIVLDLLGLSLCNLTKGVLPMVCSMVE
jgi:hypothetical protein